MPSLLRSEAVRRAQLIAVDHAEVELWLDAGSDTFRSRTTIRFGCAEPGAASFVELAARTLDAAELNGRPLTAASLGGADGRLTLTGLAERNVLVVDATMAYRNDGEGLCRHVDPLDGETYLYAMSFLDAGPRWFCCFDQPDLKCGYRLRVHAPEHWTVLGNGPAVRAAPGEWTIEQPVPLASYCVTLVAGPYVSQRAEHDGIPLGVHARRSLAATLAHDAPDILAVTAASFDHYHRLFGIRYPFGEYHQVFAPEFNAGAMENPGCVTVRESLLFTSRPSRGELARRNSVVAHELAHMWFGDLVTMTWWDDLWLNESFAEYLALCTCAAVTADDPWVGFAVDRKGWGMLADTAPSTHPVAGNGAADAQAALGEFDGISYAKGAAVLKQLAAFCGEPDPASPRPEGAFLGGIRDHIRAHAGGNATFADLLGAWQRALDARPEGAGRELAAWAEAWLRTAGPDLLRPVRDGAGAVRITREPPPGQPPAPRPHAVTVAALAADAAELARVPALIGTDAAAVLDLPAGTAGVVVDAADATWARLRPLHGWAHPPLTAIRDDVTRAVGYLSLIDGVRSAELAPSAALALIADAVATEPNEVLLHAVGEFAADQLVGPYTAPPGRPAGRALLSAAIEDALAATEPGSDRQLVLLRLALKVDDDVDRLAERAEGSLPAGVSPDLDLRWAAVTRLVALSADPALIERHLAIDPSSAARVHAARARAEIPEPWAKQAALDLILKRSELSAYELYATAEGLFRPEHHELTAPLVERYFAGIGATADFRTGWMLGRVAQQGFPAAAVGPDTVRLARRSLAAPTLAPGLRRTLTDALDQVERAVAALGSEATK